MNTLAIEGVIMTAHPEFGCYWGKLDRTLFYCPMNEDGSPDYFNWGEVELLGKKEAEAVKLHYGDIDFSNISIED